MANCLILLAQGTAMAAAEGFVYQCKTCERCFSSFQALGGHRASHKRPREKSNDSKAAAAGKSVDGKGELDLSLGMVNTAAVGKVHECSICGAGFSSGQDGGCGGEKWVGVGFEFAGAGRCGWAGSEEVSICFLVDGDGSGGGFYFGGLPFLIFF
ncbi:Zinc finger protein ZAT5 [Linum perenne]